MRHPRWPLVVAVVAIAALCALAAWRPLSVAAPPSAGAESAVVGPAPLALPDEPRVLVFGDSWTYGSAAALPAFGYAYVVSGSLGWEATVDGVRGSGYLRPGSDGGAYGERIAHLDPALDPDLVIVQGSINDRVRYPTGYAEAVTAAWDELAALYPDARIVIVGPAPQVLPVEAGTTGIDAALARLAGERGWWYISPIADDWITPENYLDVIDTGEVGRNHPSTAGHAYLAQRLADALALISDGAAIAAVDY